MDKKKIKKIVGIALSLAIIVIGISYNSYVRAHTFTLSAGEITKSEQIQPIFGSVKVTGTTDTNVVFTDTASGQSYEIGYITPGMVEKIQLEQGKWYKVEGSGDLTIRPINVRIE